MTPYYLFRVYSSLLILSEYGKKTNTGILGFSFSWKRALGIAQVKQKIVRKTGIPTLKAGLEKKIGIIMLNLFFLEKS